MSSRVVCDVCKKDCLLDHWRIKHEHWRGGYWVPEKFRPIDLCAECYAVEIEPFISRVKEAIDAKGLQSA